MIKSSFCSIFVKLSSFLSNSDHHLKDPFKIVINNNKYLTRYKHFTLCPKFPVLLKMSEAIVIFLVVLQIAIICCCVYAFHVYCAKPCRLGKSLNLLY